MKLLGITIFISFSIFGACSGSKSAQSVDAEQNCPGVAGDGIVYSPNTYLHLPSPDNPAEGVGVADPHVILVGETWYLFGTDPGEDLKVWSSADLATWSFAGVVWSPTPGSWNDNGKIWAPHVEAGDDGKFYLYYSANERIGVAVSEGPTGPYEEVYDHPFVGDGYGGELSDAAIAATDGSDSVEKAIDAFVLREPDGTLTFFYTAFKPFNSIYGRTMIDYVTFADDPAELLIEPLFPSWESFVNEGPWVFEYAGKYFLSYSGFGADRAGYSIGVAAADNPLGPYLKSPANPILHQNAEAEIWGPGHHSIVPGIGCDLLLFYHSKLSPEPGWARKVRYIPVALNEETGFEIVGGHP